MSQPHGSNLWTEPAANGGTPTVTTAVLVLDGSDWTFSTTADADGGFEDDGTGDFTIYTTAMLPGLNTQLALIVIRDDLTAYEVEP